MNLETIYNDYRWRPTDGDYKKKKDLNIKIPLSVKFKKAIHNNYGYIKYIFKRISIF